MNKYSKRKEREGMLGYRDKDRRRRRLGERCLCRRSCYKRCLLAFRPHSGSLTTNAVEEQFTDRKLYIHTSLREQYKIKV